MLRFPSLRFLPPVTALALASVACAAAETPVKDSPFLPRGTTAAPAGAAADGYLLSGYVAQGKGGLLSVTQLSDKRSFWIPLGGTVNGITALSYDTHLDQAVIRADGRTLTISLRKSAIIPGANITMAVTSAPTPASSTTPASANPSLPPQPPPPALGTPAFQEQEARMLVTDLLEIGLEQRKAYEEAQRQAAARPAAASTPPRH
jgi:hypothetical protein